MTRILAVSLGVALAGMSSAQVAAPDPHIQSVAYDAGRIVPLRIAPGFVTTVAFAPDERIENVAVGNRAGWQVTANKRGDHLFIRALQDGGTTNLEVVTDQRHYGFLLTAGGAGEVDTIFSLRFDYGPGGPAAARPSSAVTVADAPGLYRLSGTRRLRPSAMSDDGRVTRICWPARDAIPVIFARDAAGKERLVNSRMENDCSVIDAIWPDYRFVAGANAAIARRIVEGKRR